MAEVTKEQAVKALTSKKYIAQNDKGVIMVSYSAGENYKKVLEEVKKILKAAGFVGSFGVRPISGKEYAERTAHEDTLSEEKLLDEDIILDEEEDAPLANENDIQTNEATSNENVSNETKQNSVANKKQTDENNSNESMDNNDSEEYYDEDEDDDAEIAKKKAAFIDSLDDFDSFSFGDGMQMSLFDVFDE